MLAERQGLHPGVLQPLRGMYRELRRRFVMAGHVEKEFVASDGIIQGCPQSVLLLNLLMSTWARSVKAGTTTAMPKVYVDDAGVLSKNSRKHLHRSENHRTLCALCEKPRPERGAPGCCQQSQNLLGFTNDVAEERVGKGITISRRIRWALLPGQNESQLDCVFGWASSHVWLLCRWLYFIANSGGRGGTKRRRRCREIVLTLFVKGHLVDSLQNAAHPSLRQLRRMAERRPEAFAEKKSVGPVATMHSILRKGWGWHWQTPTLFVREGRSHLGWLEGPESWWLHEIRQGLRLAESRRTGNRRNDMRVIESMAGIDKLATSKAMNSTKIPPEQRNDLRALLCGCVFAMERTLSCSLFCGEEPEDEEHILWRCLCFFVRSKPTRLGSLGVAAVHPRDVVSLWKSLSQLQGRTWTKYTSTIDQLQHLARQRPFG